MSMGDTEAKRSAAWQAHVSHCSFCSVGNSYAELCPAGKNFWAPPPSAASDQQTAPASEARAPEVNLVDQITKQVVARVVARSQSGGAISVPMEKTSRAVSFATAPNVVLHMPERDIEVYSEMKKMIQSMVLLADALAKSVLVAEETRRAIRTTSDVSEHQVGMVLRRAGAHFGVSSEEQLFYDFEMMTGKILTMGDRLGAFMRVDDETRRIMKSTRTLGIDMQGEMERDPGRLKLDEETRKLVRPLRMLALELQGEIERRVGT